MDGDVPGADWFHGCHIEYHGTDAGFGNAATARDLHFQRGSTCHLSAAAEQAINRRLAGPGVQQPGRRQRCVRAVRGEVADYIDE